MSTSYAELEDQFDFHVGRIAQAVLNLDLENPAVYAAWISQTYYFVRHTTRFLTIAASNVTVDDRESHYDWIHHLKGELNHDKVAANDLKALGHSTTDFPELVETQLLYQSQYFWLDRVSSAALIGYALLLEGLACKYGEQILSRISVHGHNATTFMKLHCEVDATHYVDGLNSLMKMDASDYPAILQNLTQSGKLYCDAMARIASGTVTSRNIKVA